MEESKDCRSPRSEAVWASRTTTPASSREGTPRGGAGGDAAGGEAVAPPPSVAAPAREQPTNDVEPYRLSYDLGNLQMGIHNATVVMRSAATPPKFDPVKNTSLFLTPTLGDPQAPPPGDGGEVAAAGDAESAPAA